MYIEIKQNSTEKAITDKTLSEACCVPSVYFEGGRIHICLEKKGTRKKSATDEFLNLIIT